MASPFRVRVFRGEKLLDERIFTETLVKIGRHSSAQVPLDDRGASFVHAVITIDGDELALTDVSGRGTFVNGKSVGKKVLLPSEEIRIAGLSIVVDRPGTPAPAMAVQPVAPEPVAAQAIAPEPVAPPSEPLPAPAPVALVEPPAACVSAQAPLPEVAPAHQALPSPRPIDYSAPASPQRALRPGDRPALQLACYWGDTLLQVTQHGEPQTLLMGPTSRCAVKAGSRERPLIEPLDGGFALSVEDGACAHLRRGEAVEELGPGLHALEPTDLAWVEAGPLRVEASFAARPSPAKVPLAASIDFRLVNLVLALSFLAAAFAVSAQFRSTDDLIADDDAQLNRLVVQVMEPLKRAKLRTDAVASLQTTEAAPAPKLPGPEGAAGDPTKKHTRPAIGALGNVRLDTRNLVSRSGLLAGMGGQSIANMLGTGGFRSDVAAALGNLTGPNYGSAGGVGGMGVRGNGWGGGGDTRTFGIGGISTLGRAGGNALFGSGHGLPSGRKDGPPVVIDSAPPETGGSLDPELVRQVIRSHVSQIRFCYEDRLATQPSLEGKLRIRFLVASNGAVPQASVAEGSTIHDPVLSACILSRVKSWIFPSPKGGGDALVTYPFWLRPSGN